MNAPQKTVNTWLADRSAGIFILLLSLSASYFTIVRPVTGMFQGREDVIFSTNIIIVTAVGILFGLSYVIFGGAGMNRLANPNGRKETIQSIVFAVVILATLVGLLEVWSRLVTTLGYG